MERIEVPSLKIRPYDNFVRCRICRKYLRVISGRHLSTHGTDRESYMQEYRLSPDKLCSKSFRVNHSSRADYHPHSRREWIAAMKAVYKQHGNVYAGFLQKQYPQLYQQGIWLFGDWDAALRVPGFTAENMRLRTCWDDERVMSKYSSCVERAFLSTRHTFLDIIQNCFPQLYAYLGLGVTHYLLPV